MALRCSILVKTTKCISINQPKCRFLIRKWKNFKRKIIRQRNKCWTLWFSWEGPFKSSLRTEKLLTTASTILLFSQLHLEYCVKLYPHVWMILINWTRPSTWSELGNDPALRPPEVPARLRDFHAVPTGFVTEEYACTPEISSGNLLWQIAGSSKEQKKNSLLPFYVCLFHNRISSTKS